MNDVIVRRPRLLRKGSSSAVPFAEVGRFNPIRLSIEINMQPLSTATMILAEDDLDVSIHDFVEIYNQHGSVGIFRVASVETDYRKQRTVELNHALDVLNDSVYGRTDADEESFDGTPTAFLEKMLGAQTQGIGSGENITPFWRLGAVSDTEAWRKKLRFANVLEELCDLAKEHEDYYYTFDFSTFPWRVDFVPRPSSSSVVSEFRLNRNITDCSVTLDDDDLCTRLYLSVDVTRDQLIDKDGKDPMKPDTSSDETPSDTASNETVSNEGEEGQSTASEEPTVVGEKTEQYFYTFDDTANQARWGIVSRTAGMEVGKLTFEDDPQALALAYARQYFQRHGSPTVQITINGQDLKKLTGVNIDEMKMGTICRVALPEYGGTKFVERVVSVSYPDALRQPTVVQVQMANKRASTEDSIAAVKKEAKKAGGGGGGARRKADNLETELAFQKIRYQLRVEQDDKHWALIASEEEWAQLEQGGETLVGGYYAHIEVTARYFQSIFKKTGIDGLGEDESLLSRITQTAKSIETEVSRATAAEGELSSRITQTASSITAEVTRAMAAEDELSARITLTAESLTSEISRATSAEGEMYSRITQTASSITTIVQKTGIDGLDGESLYSRIVQTAESITQEVARATSAEGEMYSRITQTASSITSLVSKTGVDELGQGESLYSRITQTAESITQEVARAQSEEGLLYSRITQTAESISLIVSQEVLDSLGEQETIYSRITQTATSIQTQVSGLDGRMSAVEMTASTLTATVADKLDKSSISMTSTSITLDAQTIDLSGYVTATYVDTEIAEMQQTYAGYISSASAVFDGLVVTGQSDLGTVYCDSLYVGNADVTDAIDTISDGSASGGTVTFAYTTIGGGTGSFSFDIADTQYFQDAVASAEAQGASGVTLSARGWQNGENRVEASNGEYEDVALPAFTTSGGTFSGNATTTTVTFSTASVATPLAQVLVDAGGVYTNGLTDGQNSVNVSKGRWSGGVITFSPSAGTGSSKTCTLSVSESAWNTSGQKTITVLDGGGSTGYTATVTANVTSSTYNSPGDSTVGTYDVMIDGVKQYSFSATGAYRAGARRGASSVEVTSLAYDSSAHTYTATATATNAVGGTYTDTMASGTEAWDAVQISADNITQYQTAAYRSAEIKIRVYIKALADNGYSRQKYFDIDATAAYNAGWNDCRKACTTYSALRDFNSYGNATLYVAPTGGAAAATGSAQNWYYGGRTVTGYVIPAAK